MDDPESAAPVLPTLGRYVTLRSTDRSAGEAYECIGHTADMVTLRPVLPERSLPDVGELVECSSDAGTWQASVARRHGDRVVLEVPRWVRRSRRRQSVRVPCTAVVRLSLGVTVWASRLEDLSQSGGALTMEASAPLSPGMAVHCALPEGETLAEVRSVRPHQHALLCVVGVEWFDTDAAGVAWIRRSLGRRRSPTRRQSG